MMVNGGGWELCGIVRDARDGREKGAVAVEVISPVSDVLM